MENADLKYIKKHYSEQMAHLCRELFPTILETPGLLFKLLENNFAHSSSLAEDIIKQEKQNEFKSLIYSFIEQKEDNEDNNKDKSPKELFDEAGYILYPECKTEEDIQKFKHYYVKGEELCTFKGGRLNSCRVWFAVKKNVDQIKREDFKHPERQDAYGTSVISIQFSKQSNWLSIKNRYNHTVSNPDATFSNNLDNIIHGLSCAFSQTYDVKIDDNNHDFELKNYVLAGDGKYYKYNYEINNIYYCENNMIIDNGTPKQLDPARYILMDYFIVDMTKGNQSITTKCQDSFSESFGEILGISVERDENKNRVLRFKVKDGEDILVTLNKCNKIIKYDNKNIVSVGNNFLYYNEALEEINIPSVKTISNGFLYCNESLTKLNLPLLTSAGDWFLYYGGSFQEVYLPKLESVGDGFLSHNHSQTLTRLDLPLLTKAGSAFMAMNRSVKYVNLPSLTSINEFFLYINNSLEEINIPSVETISYNFLSGNASLKKLYLPALTSVGNHFFDERGLLEEIYAPKLKTVGNSFLRSNDGLKRIYLPMLTKAGDDFLSANRIIEEVNLPLLNTVGDSFLSRNDALKELYLPSLESAGDSFLHFNKSLKKLELPKILFLGVCPLYRHPDSASLLNKHKDQITDLQK